MGWGGSGAADRMFQSYIGVRLISIKWGLDEKGPRSVIVEN
jgi:hypothetical protein